MHLHRIDIFPIKSLDGVPVREARITGGGILENDRVYAMLDEEGKYVNGKRVARVHQLRCAFDHAFQEVRLWHTGETAGQFALKESGPINRWLTDFFGFSVALHHETQKGFPDDREAFGPTIVSEASLRTIQQWYPSVTFESVRRRFRANLELTGGAAFCEDQLFGAAGELKPFAIGPVRFLGHNPCQRCAVLHARSGNGRNDRGIPKNVHATAPAAPAVLVEFRPVQSLLPVRHQHFHPADRDEQGVTRRRSGERGIMASWPVRERPL